MRKILVVGQTPPPHGGQAVMIDNMLRAQFKGVKLYHVRMAFSSDMEEVGKFKLNKILKLFHLIFLIFYFKFRYGIKNLYYPPAPPHKVPMLRDIIILLSTRWLFQNIVFHFHAAGISEMHGKLKGVLKVLYEKAYFYPDVCVRLSEYNPEDGKFFKTKREFLIPNGLDDIASPYLPLSARRKEVKIPILLSVGVLTESKGVLVLLESAKILTEKGYQFKLQFMGRFESKSFEQKVLEFIRMHQLQGSVTFLGVQTGKEKYSSFSQADIFCFPTFFEAETFGLVALEAMQFELPVVATKWRGVPSIVRNGENGFTVPPQDPYSFADKLEILINDPFLRIQMGRTGRKIYCSNYTSQIHFEQMSNVFTTL